MIQLTRLNGMPVTINALLIESLESAPNTVVNLVTGNRFIVKESVDDVVGKVVDFQRRIHAGGKPINPLEGLPKRP